MVDKKFAEFVGAVIGDGNLYDKGPTYVEICGDPILDADYMGNLSRTLSRDFCLRNKLKARSHGLRLRLNNKNLVELLRDLGLPSGKNKFSRVRIPDFFLPRNELCVACVRGIFDTDGCVFHDKRKVYRRPYVRICLHMKNRALLKQVKRILESVDVKSTINTNGSNLSINGPVEVNKFLRNVGFSNRRHLNRIMPQ